MNISKKLLSAVFCASILGLSLNASHKITTRWEDGSGSSSVLKSSLNLKPVSDWADFNEKNMLPECYISHRNDSGFTDGAELQRKIDHLAAQVQRGEKEYEDFEILCKKDFDPKSGSGVLVAKCKNDPFVVKLFTETPKTFGQSKGMIDYFRFVMTGMTRHLSGLSRIKNRDDVQQCINSSYWRNVIDLPCKWFVLPKGNRDIKITKGSKESTVPGTYGVVAQYINSTRPSSVSNKDRLVMDFCNAIGHKLDANKENFLTEKHTEKVVCVDTEDFSSTVGAEPKNFSGDFAWRTHLVGSCLKKFLGFGS